MHYPNLIIFSIFFTQVLCLVKPPVLPGIPSYLRKNPSPGTLNSKRSLFSSKPANPEITLRAPANHVVEGIEQYAVESFLGIPMAEAPRLDVPIRRESFQSPFLAQSFPASCPQLFVDKQLENYIDGIAKKFHLDGVVPSIVNNVLNQHEDCLTTTVQRPAGIKEGDKLPVLVFIFGGGFVFGSANMYDGTRIVYQSVVRNKPVVYVALNYRVAGWGFLAGKEIKEAGASNLGMMDVRMGLEWVSDNIAAFGGDPDKVTIWGESAGSVSAFQQALVLDGDIRRNATADIFNQPKSFSPEILQNDKPLFRGIIGNSGTVVPTGPIDNARPQGIYNQVVKYAGCGEASNSLDCLRKVDSDMFRNGVEFTHSVVSNWSLSLDYVPRPDGRFFRQSSADTIQQGKFAPVPMLLGDQEDEGTLPTLLVSKFMPTREDVLGHIISVSGPENAVMARELVDSYSIEPADGSPFRTGLLNVIYPGFKMYAAILGDFIFTLMRRLVLEGMTNIHPAVATTNRLQGSTFNQTNTESDGSNNIINSDSTDNSSPVQYWSWINSAAYGTPILGTFHAQELFSLFAGVGESAATDAMFEYFLTFAYTRDPNGGKASDGGDDDVSTAAVVKPVGMPYWPAWDPDARVLLNPHAASIRFLKDDFRQNSFEVMKKYKNIYTF